jgi:hypothetical protein
MMLGDKIFFSITFFVLIGLFWLRFLDKHIPVWASLFVSIPLAVYICRLEDPVRARKREKEKLLKSRNLI